MGRSHRTLEKPRKTKENRGKRSSGPPPGGPGAPKRAPRRFQELPGAPREASEGAPGAPKSAPGGSRESPRALQELPGSSQERSEIAPRVPKSVPRAQTVAKAPWNSGYARKLQLFLAFRQRFLPTCNISSSSAASAELHSLRYLSRATFATTRWLRDATVATPRWLRYVRYATFAMLCALR